MFSKLKRFLSVSLCLIFYIFLFAGNFGGNFVCSATESATVKKYVPIDISSNFNTNEIWGIDEDWSNITGRWGHYYTKAPGRNNNADGLPTDGKITISNIPFNINVSSGNDCINVSSSTTGTINFSTPIKVKNLHVLGTLNGLNSGKYTNPDNFNVEFYDENNNEITQYTQILDAYDWCYPRKDGVVTRDNITKKVRGLETIISSGISGETVGSDKSSLVGYKNYNVRNADKEGQAVYYSSNPAMQCWRLNKFTDDSTSFEDNQIKTIKFNKIDESLSNLMIFGITAEVEPDENDNITISDVKYNQLKIACGTSSNKQVKIFTTEGLDNEGMTTTEFPYNPTVTEGTNYCTIYDPDKNAYYYFAVTTKKSLKIVVQTPSGLVYNGAAQQLVTGCSTLDANGNPRPADEDELLKPNIYLRIENSTGTPAHKTDWYNLNSLENLTATNAGIYNIYYELDKGALSDYDLISTTVVSGTSESNNSIIIDENGD